MAAPTRVVKNLQDGQIVIKDGAGSPKTLTLALDQGDLSFTTTINRIQIKDRGHIVSPPAGNVLIPPNSSPTYVGHVRRGEQDPVQVTFSAKWISLLGKAGNTSDAYDPYAFLLFHSALGLTSTAAAGWDNALSIEFTVNDSYISETITFNRFYAQTVTAAEGGEENTISVSGFDFNPFAPIITRN